MKYFLFAIFMLVAVNKIIFAQSPDQVKIDSLRHLVDFSKSDTTKVNLLNSLADIYSGINTDSGIYFSGEAVKLSSNLKWTAGTVFANFKLAGNFLRKSDNFKALEAYNAALQSAKTSKDSVLLEMCYYNIARIYLNLNNYPKALEALFTALKISEESNYKRGISICTNAIGVVYINTKEGQKGLDIFLKNKNVFEELNDTNMQAITYGNIGECYHLLHNIEKQKEYYLKALKLSEELKNTNFIAGNLDNLASVFLDEKNYTKSLEYYFKALKLFTGLGDDGNIVIVNEHLGNTYLAIAEDSILKRLPDSLRNKNVSLHKAVAYLISSIEMGKAINSIDNAQSAYKLLSRVHYLLGNYKDAFDCYSQSILLNDSINSEKNKKAIADLEFQRNTDLKQKEIEIQKMQLENAKKERIYFIAGFLLLFLFLVLLYSRFRIKAKSSRQLEEAYRNLQETQLQLIHHEKLASLGQLTAGIAHEINNPINFVSANVTPLKRNFEELSDFITKKKEVSADDLSYNIEETKKLLAGVEEGSKRTAEIVKGLRNFSRHNEEAMKRANINEGIVSTLILLQNKLNHKNIEVIKSLDNLPEIECYPGQLNQVFMNLMTNAIDAIVENGKISITTLKESKRIKISIRDSGKGMSEEVKKKIFDPFFTTKDVGKGTGLGLSISYGIIEKHNGKIEVISEPGRGSEFVISLPV